jgi:hypothetical protein
MPGVEPGRAQLAHGECGLAARTADEHEDQMHPRAR